MLGFDNLFKYFEYHYLRRKAIQEFILKHIIRVKPLQIYICVEKNLEDLIEKIKSLGYYVVEKKEEKDRVCYNLKYSLKDQPSSNTPQAYFYF